MRRFARYLLEWLQGVSLDGVHKHEARSAPFAFLALVALIVTVALVAPANVAGFFQQAVWSDPLLLAEEGTEPLLVADNAGNLHLLYVEERADDGGSPGLAINYASRSDGFWNQPVDVLFSQDGSARLSGAVVDRAGYIHLAWGDNNALYHSSAHVSHAGNAGRWNTDTVAAGRLPIGDMVLDSTGRLHVAVGIDIYNVEYVYSDDGGANWLSPLPVERVLDREHFAIGGAKLAVDSEGTLHLTWSRTAGEVDWNNWSVWYARSSDEGNSWQVSEMTEPEFGDSDILVDAEDNVHLVYGRQIRQPDGRWHRWSSDGGVTWSEPQPLYPGVDHASGLTGGFDFALDGDGRLHLVNAYGNKTGDASAWHLEWLGNRWSEPELLLDTRFHAHFPRIAASLGNQLSFVATSGRVANNGLFEMHVTIDAQPVAAEEIPPPRTPDTGDALAAGDAESNAPTPAAPRVELPEAIRAAPPADAPFNALLVAVGAAALLILVVVLIHRRFSVRR